MLTCLLCGSDHNIDDRGSYPVCSKCSEEQQACKERDKKGELLDRDVGPLCMKCGLCCVVLSAEAKPSEVEHLASWSGKLPREIAMVEETGYSRKGVIVLHRPCVFLLGKATEYVRCRAYTTKRPVVCEEYLCKLAVRYQAGKCTLNEALFILKAAISKYGSIGMFNWTQDERLDKSDQYTAFALAAKRVLSALDPHDDRVLDISFHLYKTLGKKYELVSENHGTLLAAMFANFEGNAIELDQYFSPDDMKGWSTRDKVVAKRSIYQVVNDFRCLFKVETPPEK